MPDSIQKTLLGALKSMPASEARQYAKQIAELHKIGLKRIRVFPKGIPVIDGVEIQGIIDRKELSALLPKLIDRLPSHGGVEVFPFGIPAPDLFSVKVNLR